MKKTLLIFFISCLLLACNNSRHTNYSLDDNDSIANAERIFRKLEIQDSLKKLEGNRIFADFHFGMSKNEYKVVYDKISAESNGVILIEDCEFNICEDFYVDRKAHFETFYNDVFHQLILVHKFNEKCYTPRGDIEHSKSSSEREDKFSAIVEHFEKKYGTADESFDILNYDNSSREHDGSINSADWYFDYKNIRIGLYVSDISISGDYTYTDYYLIVRIQDPKVEEKYVHVQDSIKNYQDSLYYTLEKERKEKESKYTNEL